VVDALRLVSVWLIPYADERCGELATRGGVGKVDEQRQPARGDQYLSE
jgi:hypothetical protein